MPDRTHRFVAQHTPTSYRSPTLVLLIDIKADNIMFGIKDDSVFTDFEENEHQ